MGDSPERWLGDEELFVVLYTRLRRFAAVVRPPSVDADDLVQEALARTLAARSLSSLQSPEAYLRRAVLRVAMNEHRRAGRHRARLVRVGPVPGIDVDVYPSDLAELMRLSPRVRAVLFLHVVEELPYDEVSRVMGCRPEAARKAGSRGLALLRAALDAAQEEMQ
jgi:DNA-directed RNA polymerase specialized sigma24 family protein